LGGDWMKKELKRLFSAATDEMTYKKEIITLVILLLIFVLPIIFTYFGLSQSSPNLCVN